MNTPSHNWCVIYSDGRYLTDEEVQWDEISVPRFYGSEQLSVLRDPAVSLRAIAAGRFFTLRAPDDETARFFRYYRARTSLTTGATDMLYHAIGYITDTLRLTMEIDPRGNCQVRVNVLEQPLLLNNGQGKR